ncbi:MAG TPA: cytochrome c biogenesis protein ResB [Brevibacterium senegalense]|uniref:Cytochrome c biogenesis protein ResB n=1 Tax=Brevibacterium senegalense TaxID=1033736 RepID=A0A921MD57_9MICO|nr:cytochrome c biogenesis protein ResB [Brevibacterium senegalense]
METQKTTAQKQASAGKKASGGKQAPASDIGVVGMLRWAWRQLTTMRAALMLLLVLAMAAIPGSLLPQRNQDPGAVATYIEENGALGEFLDAVQLFDVYTSVWFSAVYILLMVSLVGCILPRTRQHWRAMRQDPPRAPRRLTRMSAHRTTPLSDETTTRTQDELLERAQALLKDSGYRTVRADDHIAAERGYLKETGNLVFHVSVLVTVIIMAAGGLFGYSGQRVLVEGETFSHSLVSYDSFTPGTFFDADQLADFRLTLNDLETTFDDEATGSQFGQPRKFDADVTLDTAEGDSNFVLRPNEPVRVDGSRVYLIGNGYAPVITTRDAEGNVTYSGPVVFLPQDGVYTSTGVLKVPDAQPDQLGFGGVLLPTVDRNERGELISSFAELRNPLLVMDVYRGDLGLDTGMPQSVYQLETDTLEQLTDTDGTDLQLVMQPGDTAELPDGLGTVSFDEIRQYAALDVHHDPVQVWMLPAMALLFGGLALTLFVARRRVWVRVSGDEIEIAGLARGEDPRVEEAVDEIAQELALDSLQPSSTSASADSAQNTAGK